MGFINANYLSQVIFYISKVDRSRKKNREILYLLVRAK